MPFSTLHQTISSCKSHEGQLNNKLVIFRMPKANLSTRKAPTTDIKKHGGHSKDLRSSESVFTIRDAFTTTPFSF